MKRKQKMVENQTDFITRKMTLVELLKNYAKSMEMVFVSKALAFRYKQAIGKKVLQEGIASESTDADTGYKLKDVTMRVTDYNNVTLSLKEVVWNETSYENVIIELEAYMKDHKEYAALKPILDGIKKKNTRSRARALLSI